MKNQLLLMVVVFVCNAIASAYNAEFVKSFFIVLNAFSISVSFIGYLMIIDRVLQRCIHRK